MTEIENIKFTALFDELETAYRLIRLGFGELQNLDSVNNFYFLPFQLLSQGIERFMKAYICLAHKNKHKTFPTTNHMKLLSHNLIKAFDQIIDNYYYKYTSPQYDIDNAFLRKDKDIRELLRLLTDFGQGARYYNLDLITDSLKSDSFSPKDAWNEFRNKLLKSEDYKKLTQEDTQREVHQKIISYIILTFEKFISALSRQFIFGGLGQTAKSISVKNFFNFGQLYEKDFGTTDYRFQTQTYQAKSKKTKKRTLYNELKARLNPDYRSKKILKSEYKGDWPFYVDEVIVECREKEWCVVIIDGYQYGLNGSAQARYGLDSPHDAGMAILGKDISGFIEIAKQL